MTQKELILEFVKEYGSITPAKVGGRYYKGGVLGSESTKRCRELRAEGKLVDFQDGKFKSFKLPTKKEAPARTNLTTLQLVKQNRMEKESDQLILI